MASLVKVAVGVVTLDEKILLAERLFPSGGHRFWEFPGGKIEPLERPYDALVRELDEEISIKVLDAELLTEIEHAYDQFDVFLSVWRVTKFEGQPRGAEGQAIKWVSFNELQRETLPEANYQILPLLNL